jgi:hypothetical protein
VQEWQFLFEEKQPFNLKHVFHSHSIRCIVCVCVCVCMSVFSLMNYGLDSWTGKLVGSGTIYGSHNDSGTVGDKF